MSSPFTATILRQGEPRQNVSNAISSVPMRCSNKDMAFPRAPSFDLRAGEAFQEADALSPCKRSSVSTSDIPPAKHSSTFPRVKAELSHTRLPSFKSPSSSELHFIRKKSGEVVKPSLRVRSKSAPTLASPGAKVVHFDKQLEHVRHFRPRQTPRSISRDGGTPETSEGETSDGLPFPPPLRLLSSNLKAVPEDEPWTFDVRLESLVIDHLTPSLAGTVLVRNIAFAKSIAARFTTDAWETTSEVVAHYVFSVRGGEYDRFEFRIHLADFRKGHVVLCVRYAVQGLELWDNNHGRNYEVDFDRAPRKPEEDLRMRLGTRNLLRQPIWHGVGGETDDTDDDVFLPAPRIGLRLPKHPQAMTPHSRHSSLNHPAWNPPTSPAARASVPAGPALTFMSSTGLGSPRDSMEGRHHVRSVERESWLFAKGFPVRRTPRTQYVPPPVDDDTSTPPSSASTSASSSPSVSPVIPARALPGIAQGSKPYHTLVDQFCFFAGVSDPRRTSYGSSFEDYFSCSLQNAEFSSPTLAVVG